MPDDMKAVVERVGKYLTERSKLRQTDPEEIHGLHVGTEREAHLLATDLRALLSERRKMVEAVNLLRRIREGLWIQPQHWNIHDQPRVHELLAEIDAALTGSETNAR